MTYLQLINAVLRRLREDEVTSVNENSYSKLVGEYINETKREAEDAWNWIQLRTTIQVTCVASTFSYTLTGAGNRFRILQVINNTEDREMQRAPYKWMNSQFTNNSPQEGSPAFWDINGGTGGDPDVNLYPIPNVTDVIDFNMVLPQTDFDSDGDTLYIPSMPVILGAYAKAVSERGEDGSTQYAEAVNKYDKALSDAIAIDAMNVNNELTWEVV